MIFKTITTDLDGTINKIGLFNKSFADLRNAVSINSSNGQINNGFSGLLNSFSSTISEKDILNIKEYNRMVGEEGVSSQTAWYRTMLSSSNAAQALFDDEKNLILTENGAVVSTEALTFAQNNLTLSAKAGKAAFGALATAGNMLIGLAIGKGIELAVTAFDNYIHRAEKASEATKEAIDTFESISSEVESLEEKISDINEQILQLNPITDAADIENLKLETEELNAQLAILKEKQRIAESDADEAAQSSLRTAQASRYQLEEHPSAYGGVEVGAAYVTKDEELLNAMEAYGKYKSRVDDANKALADMSETGEYTRKEWSNQEDIIANYSEKMKEARAHANELAASLAEEKQGLNGSTEGSHELLTKIDGVINQYDEWLNAINGTTDALGEQTNAAQGLAFEPPISFSKDEYKESIDAVQSSISTLRSALDSFNQGALDESAVLDLMQQFPALIPYIDMTADGFGNLSEGLSTLIAQQPDSLIQSLDMLKSSLGTEEERAQVDALINSLQSLSSYGDTGAEAYAASVGSTWTDTANVIESVTTQFENLAKVQEAVANGLTMSSAAAAELAKMYPEILTNAEISSDGQITLNEDVVQSVLDGDRSVIDAQVTKLEADKAELTAKKSYAEAQLEMLKQVGEGEGQITEEVAQYRLDVADKLLHALIDAGLEEDQAYAAVAANMAGNMDEYNRIVGVVAEDIAANMGQSAVSMAKSFNDNSNNAQTSLHNIQQKAWDLANTIRAGANGVREGKDGIYGGGGYTPSNGIKAQRHSGNFSTATADYTPDDISLTDFKSQLEIDIKGYTDAIANIDSQIAMLKNLQASFEHNGGVGGHGYSEQIKALENEKNTLNNALNDSGGSAAQAKDEYTELFDFFERRVKNLDTALSLLKSNLDNVTGSYAKNSLLDAEIGINEEKIKNYSDALAMYTEKANEALAKIPSDIASKVTDGSVELTTFIGDGNKEVAEAIREYESWADKVSDCSEELAKLQKEIRQLELEKFNNITEEFDSRFDLRETGKDLISKQIDLLKEAGQFVGESFYTAQAEQSRKQLALLEEEKARLAEQMAYAIGSGKVQKGTDEWLAMTNALSDVEGNILDCQKAIEGFDNELQQLHWDVFDRIQGQFKNLDSELSNLGGLFDDSKVTDGGAGWSKEGLAQLGLLAQQYELAQHQIQRYGDAIDELNSDYLARNYSASEYADKLSELSAAQWDAVNASESAKDAVIKLNETRINEEIDAIEKEKDAYQKLTAAQTEALKASKDLHDYQQTIAEKTKSVTDLEKRLAAMSGDTSASATAKKKQLEEQLAAARSELESTEYSHSIETQEQALQSQQENYEAQRTAEIDVLKASLAEKEMLLAQSFEIVKQNAALIGQEIAATAAVHGITVSDEIIHPWQNGEMAIAGYGVVLTENTSAFIGNLLGLEWEVYNLQAQADTTANSLSWMLSTRADNLVNELTAAYSSEQNLTYMTQALHDSLTATLEGGYNISGISNALSGIAGSLDGVASSAQRAANAIRSVGAEQTASYSPSNSGSSTSGLLQSIKDTASTIQTVIDTYQDIDKSAKKSSSASKGGGGGGKQMTMMAYAKGGIIKKDAGNPLNRIAESVGEDTLVATKEGESILTERQTAAFQKLAERFGTNADGLIPIPADFNMFCLTDTAIQSADAARFEAGLPHLQKQPEIVSTNAAQGNSVNVHYDSLIAVNGDVNDTKHFLNDMQNVAQNAIKKSWHDFEMTRKYGLY